MATTKQMQERAKAKKAELKLQPFKMVAAAVAFEWNASGRVDGSCYRQTKLAQKMLKELGIESKLVCGYAGWKFGPNEADNIVHHPKYSIDVKGSSYHTWLEVDGKIFDVTTHTFEHNARRSEAMDGIPTRVTWKPDYLLITKGSTTTIHGLLGKVGACYYEPHDQAIVDALCARYEAGLSERG